MKSNYIGKVLDIYEKRPCAAYHNGILLKTFESRNQAAKYFNTTPLKISLAISRRGCIFSTISGKKEKYHIRHLTTKN